jgi:hypothetical protein
MVVDNFYSSNSRIVVFPLFIYGLVLTKKAWGNKCFLKQIRPYTQQRKLDAFATQGLDQGERSLM